MKRLHLNKLGTYYSRAAGHMKVEDPVVSDWTTQPLNSGSIMKVEQLNKTPDFVPSFERKKAGRSIGASSQTTPSHRACLGDFPCTEQFAARRPLPRPPSQTLSC